MVVVVQPRGGGWVWSRQRQCNDIGAPSILSNAISLSSVILMAKASARVVNGSTAAMPCRMRALRLCGTDLPGAVRRQRTLEVKRRLDSSCELHVATACSNAGQPGEEPEQKWVR